MVIRLYHNAQGAHILALAESWIGTPYRHQARTKHIGCDCLGLVLGVWQELSGDCPKFNANYNKDWAETANEDRLLLAGQKNFVEITSKEARLGDVLTFRWSEFSASKHLGILADNGQMIHAFERHGVCRAFIVPSWRKRISGVFRFPEKSKRE